MYLGRACVHPVAGMPSADPRHGPQSGSGAEFALESVASGSGLGRTAQCLPPWAEIPFDVTGIVIEEAFNVLVAGLARRFR
jgi:hypothetical protein